VVWGGDTNGILNIAAATRLGVTFEPVGLPPSLIAQRGRGRAELGVGYGRAERSGGGTNQPK